LNNLNPGFSIGQFIGRYWPFLLIGAGVIGLIEVLANASAGIDPARRRWWLFWLVFLIPFLVSHARWRHQWTNWGAGGVSLLGAEYDYDVNASAPSDGISRVVLDNISGALNVRGEGDGDVTISGRRTIRAFTKSEADRANSQSQVRVERQGDLLVIRTEPSNGNRAISLSADLDITIPRRLNVEARGRAGDLSVEGIDGSVDVANGRGDLRLSNIGNDVRIEASRSGLIRAVAVRGNLDMDGHGSDVQLENIAGQTTVNGEYSGTLVFRNLTKGMHFHSSRTDFRVEGIPGSITMDLGDLKLENVAGPVHFQTTSRDIQVTDVTEELDISVNRGDIQITETKAPLPKMDVHSRVGDITLAIPGSASFILDGRTSQGEVQNDYGSPLDTASQHRSSTISGGAGNGPRLLLTTGRGTVKIEKS
jgi:DUF4097 and DUF4098 domain-containing protein YvlB